MFGISYLNGYPIPRKGNSTPRVNFSGHKYQAPNQPMHFGRDIVQMRKVHKNLMPFIEEKEQEGKDSEDGVAKVTTSIGLTGEVEKLEPGKHRLATHLGRDGVEVVVNENGDVLVADISKHGEVFHYTAPTELAPKTQRDHMPVEVSQAVRLVDGMLRQCKEDEAKAEEEQ